MSNPLTDVLPPKYRKVFYAALFLVGLIFAVWQASDGDWSAFALGLVTALGGGTAASNTKTKRGTITGASSISGTITTGSSGLLVQADPVEQGRQIQQALDAYHRAGGRPSGPRQR